MQLTFYSDYSFRVLFYLANMKKDSATIAEIADFYQISKNHLVKVVHQLSKEGFIMSLRGKGGGIKLAKSPNEIKLSDVARKTEPHFSLVECFSANQNQCIIMCSCKLKGIMHEALTAFFQILENYTIADTINNRLANQIKRALLNER